MLVARGREERAATHAENGGERCSGAFRPLFQPLAGENNHAPRIEWCEFSGLRRGADLVRWTNMPRDKAYEGPETDSSDAPASSEHAFIEHWYGLAGGLTGSDMVSGPKTW